MVRITVALMAGIGLEIFADSVLNMSRQIFWISVAVMMATGALLLLDIFTKRVVLAYRLRNISSVLVITFLVCFGYMHTWLYAQKNFPNHFQNFLEKESVVVAQITKPPLDKAKVVVAVAEVLEVKNDLHVQKAKGNILINLMRDSLSADLKYGDVFVFNSNIDQFEEPKNPEEFSFKLYQSFHNVYQRTFLKPDDWTLLTSNKGSFIIDKVYQIREYFLEQIGKYVSDKNDFAVASAIMLGYNDYMNGDVIRAYSSSGALHVLSVSGLHVGIMFLMLNFLLKPFDSKGRKWQISKSAFIILFIWFYACLTGLSPSVLRSAMMFSMIQFGTVLVRNVNTYNVIFASALLLILYNPFIVTEVGFRLSYLAVLGIIYLHPKIYSWINIDVPTTTEFEKQRSWAKKPFTFLMHDKSWLWLKTIDFFWQIVAVSLAAQIATSPLSLYYFHQFPNLFLISNLVVIPVSNFILFFGTALCAFSQVPHLGGAIGWCFENLLHELNRFVFYVDSLPFALIEGISIAMVEMIAGYLLLAFFFLFWYEKLSVKWLIMSLFILFGLSAFNSFEQLRKARQMQLVVYSVPEQHALALVKGRHVTTHFDKSLLENRSSMLFHVKHHWWSCGVSSSTELDTNAQRKFEFGTLLSFEGMKILVIDTLFDKQHTDMESKLIVDLVVLSRNAKVYLSSLKKSVDFKEVIFDSSNKFWRVNYWKKDCAKMNVKYWDVNEQGAYIRDLRQEKFSLTQL